MLKEMPPITPNTLIEELDGYTDPNVSIRTFKFLQELAKASGARTVADLAHFSLAELCVRRNWSKVVTREMRAVLAEAGLVLRGEPALPETAPDRDAVKELFDLVREAGAKVTLHGEAIESVDELRARVDDLVKFRAALLSGGDARVEAAVETIRDWGEGMDAGSARALLSLVVERLGGWRPPERVGERERQLLVALRRYYRGYDVRPSECREEDILNCRVTPEAHRRATAMLSFYEKLYPEEYVNAVRSPGGDR